MFTPIRDRKVRIAVIGCGRISQNHFGAIEKHSDHLELAAICDTDSKTLAEHAARFNVPAFADYEALLRESDCDMVSLCTPSGLHPSQAIMAAKYRKLVIPKNPWPPAGKTAWTWSRPVMTPGYFFLWSSRTAATPLCSF